MGGSRAPVDLNWKRPRLKVVVFDLGAVFVHDCSSGPTLSVKY